MLRAALRDLQWRRKRFVITVLGTALVFAMSLLMSGLANSFIVEVDRSLDDQRTDVWFAPKDSAGPFSAGLGVTPEMLGAVKAVPGIVDAARVLFSRVTAEVGTAQVDVNLFGVESGTVGAPPKAVSGESVPAAGSVVVPASLGWKVGETVRIGRSSYTVGGVVAKASLVAGAANVYMTLADAQAEIVGGIDRASMIVATYESDGTAVRAPSGLSVFDRAAAKDDLLRPLKNATSSIDFIKFLLWAVAALIVASVVYLTTLERTRDLAVFKATGVKTSAIGAGICLQAVILAVAASVVGGALALVLAPTFPMEVVISTPSLLALPLLAVVVGVVAGLVGVRRTAGIDPAAAFGGP